MKILLHMCCGPCSTYSTKHFRELAYDVQGYFYNPNIHPYKEFTRRLDALESFCEQEHVSLLVRQDYELEKYLQSAVNDLENRCRLCYRLRLDEAAKTAAELEIPRFATTLAISPYQNHEVLQQEGEAAGQKYGVEFVYVDLRPGFQKSAESAKHLGLYRQPYCGCIFSEKERYYKESR